MKFLPDDLKIPKPIDLVTIGYQCFIVITIIFHFFSIPNPVLLIFYHIFIISFLIWLANAKQNKVIQWMRDLYPIVIIPTNFHELHYLVNNVNPVDFDQLLINIDYAMFGVHPTIWLEQWSNPIAVEYLQIVYTTFYFLPIILAAILYSRGEKDNFGYSIYIMVLGFYLSYIFYFLVPAIGPRFTLDHLQIQPVTGMWLTSSIRETLDLLENIQRDAFPSGHTAITLLTMFYAWRYSKIYFWIIMIIGTSLIFSTVYLRYHYVIDVIAGIMLTLVVIYIARPLYDRLYNFGKTDAVV